MARAGSIAPIPPRRSTAYAPPDLSGVTADDVERRCRAALARHAPAAADAPPPPLPLVVDLLQETLQRKVLRQFYQAWRCFGAAARQKASGDAERRARVYKKMATDRLDLLEKAKAKIQALTSEVAEYREMVMEGKKEVADLRVKAQYARENMFLETLQLEERALRAIDKEIEDKSLTAADTQNYCRTCFNIIAGGGGGHNGKANDKGAAADDVGPALQHRWDSLPLERRRDITIARSINTLREQVKYADAAAKQQQEYGDNMYASLKKMYTTYLEDAKFNAQFKAVSAADLEAEGVVFTPTSQTLTPAASPPPAPLQPLDASVKEGAVEGGRATPAPGALTAHGIAQQQKAEMVRTNFVLLRGCIEEFRQSVRTQAKQLQRMMAEGHARVGELVQDHIGSAEHPKLLLHKFDEFYSEFKEWAQAIEWPYHLAEKLSIEYDSFAPLAAIPLGAKTSTQVLERLAVRFHEVFDFMGNTVAGFLGEAQQRVVERAEAQTHITGLEFDLKKAEDRYDKAVEENARQKSRYNELNDKLAVVEENWKHEYEALDASFKAAQKELEKTAANRREVPPPPPPPPPEPKKPPMLDASTNTATHVDSDTNTAVTFSGAGAAAAATADAAVNTTILVDVAAQTVRDKRLANRKVELKTVQQQTVDFFFAHAMTQTPRAVTRHTAAGVDKSTMGTMTDAGVVPNHFDGTSTTTTTFCLAQSKRSKASKAYTYVKYICVDDLAEEEPAQREVDDPVECQFIVSQLKVSLRNAFVRVDCIRQLLVAYRYLYDRLSYFASPPPQGRKALAPPSGDYVLPEDVLGIVEESAAFDADICLMHKPDVGAPQPPALPSPPPVRPPHPLGVPRAPTVSPYPASDAHDGGGSGGGPILSHRPWKPTKAKPKGVPTHRALLRAQKRGGGTHAATTPLPELSHTPLTSRPCR